MACAGLLVAAPLALFLSGGSDGAASSRVPDGVFTGGPATDTEEGTGRGGAGVATESSESPEAGLPPVEGTVNVAPEGFAADAGVAGDGSDGAVGAGAAPAGGGDVGGGTGRGTAAGTPARPAGGGSGPDGGPGPGGGSSGGSGPGTATPGGTEPGEGDRPPPAEEDEDCGCPPNPLEPVTDVVDGLTNTVGGTVGRLLGP
jgi:hypothetical protein